MNKGLSLMICFGGIVKPHIRFSHNSFRICLGFVAITLYLYDYETTIYNIIKHYSEISENKQDNKNYKREDECELSICREHPEIACEKCKKTM